MNRVGKRRAGVLGIGNNGIKGIKKKRKKRKKYYVPLIRSHNESAYRQGMRYLEVICVGPIPSFWEWTEACRALIEGSDN